MSLRKFWTTFRAIKIVKFSDDTYGIRKGWIFYRFLSRGRRWTGKEWADHFDCGNKEGNFTRCVAEYEEFFIDTGTPVEYERIYTENTNTDR